MAEDALLKTNTPKLALVAALTLLTPLFIAGCSGSSSDGLGSTATTTTGGGGGTTTPGGGTGGGGTTPLPPGRTTVIHPGPTATQDALDAFVAALPGDTIEFACGFFDITQTLLLSNTEGVTIKGCGKDKTVLSFRNSNGVEGILMDNVRGVIVTKLTVADSAGNGFELRSVDHGTLSSVRAYWSSGGGKHSADPISADNYQDGRLDIPCTDPPTQDPAAQENAGGDITSPDYEPSDGAGRYGIYPVKSVNILIENSESTGASDAGIYVGQSSNSIIRNNRAVYNVFGFEIENVQDGEYANNLAECNTGGFLIYDLDNLTQYGTRTRMYGNVSRMNNTYNFTEGGIVSQIPNGTGMLTLAYDRIDVFDNKFEDNGFGGIIHIAYELLPEGAGRPTDRKIDFYTEGLHIFRNEFKNNGNAVPAATTDDLANENIAKALPALVGLKVQAGCAANPAACPPGPGYRSGHIIWDGLLDEYDPDCPYPVDNNGDPIPADEEGKPQYTDAHPQPDCYYNAYKFHTDQPGNPRKLPLFFTSCIDDNNTYSDDSLKYANFHGTKGANAAIALAVGQPPTPQQLAEFQEFPATFDMTPHRCEEQYGSNLEPLPPVVIPPFEFSGDVDPRPTPEETAAKCEVDLTPGEVNFGAATVDCPFLHQYNLFGDAEDPRSTPNSDGTPFVLNSKLFSDYAVKYRVLYLPPGQKATYSAPGGESPNTTIVFPVGTIIAKTFAFPNGSSEDIIETRLIIKRQSTSGQFRWTGLAYVWGEDEGGNRIAQLRPGGATASVSWDYTDPESGTPHAGSTANYSIPNANQCISCHRNDDLDEGAAPIGPKVRNLNRPYRSESNIMTDQSEHEVQGLNQIAYWCNTGIMAGCPSDLGINVATQVATNLERVPRFTIPGDAGHPAGSDADIEARARAWLEVNCMHCHNNRGFASNTGFFLDYFRKVNQSYGICKGPTATGAEGSGGRAVDIHPSDASRSILEFRISPAATTPAAKMPPIARSVVDEEGHALVRQWINDVIVPDESRYPGSTSCTN